MTITGISIANFKAFSASQDISLRPITLIYGANSAGKSSLLHALALAHHAVDTGDLDTQRTRIGGEAIDLGGFRQYVHQRQEGRQVELRFRLASARITGRLEAAVRATREVEVAISIGLSPVFVRIADFIRTRAKCSAKDLFLEFGAGVPAQKAAVRKAQSLGHWIGTKEDEDPEVVGTYLYLGFAPGECPPVPDGYTVPAGTVQETYLRDMEVGGQDHVRLQRLELRVDGALLLAMSARADGLLRLDQLDHGHPVFRNVLEDCMRSLSTVYAYGDNTEGMRDLLDSLVPRVVAKRRGLFPHIEQTLDSGEPEVQVPSDRPRIGADEPRADWTSAAAISLPLALRELVVGVSTKLEDDIRRLRYLGPLRSYPPRQLAFSQHYDPNWFAGGGYAWDVVRTRSDVRRHVNEWLGNKDRLKTPYELVVRDLMTADDVSKGLRSRLRKTLHDFAALLISEIPISPDLESMAYDLPERMADLDPDDADDLVPQVDDVVTSLVDEDEVAERWIEELLKTRSEELHDLVLIDNRTGTPVSHRDVGIGVSQVLPVLVSAYASKEKLLAIEQPEIHLHPALQAELGDVFIESALGPRSNTFLIETHSEHLLLRIMRRIRETAAKKLPDGLIPVRPEHVMVLFVEPHGPHSIVREMPLNERGELVNAWPGGFFEEGLREIF